MKKGSGFFRMRLFSSFYLGFLASVGLSFGLLMVAGIVRKLLELWFGVSFVVYSRIAFIFFYLFFVVYTYKLCGMGKNRALRNGFFLFAVLYILGQAYFWLV